MQNDLKRRKLRELLFLLAQNPRFEKFKSQLEDLSQELIALKQTNDLDELIKKYQELIRLILTDVAGGSGGGSGDTSLVPTMNPKKLSKELVKIDTAINKLLEEKIQTQPNPLAILGELVATIILGIFSFFMSSIEELDEETKHELNQALTKYKQQQKADNVATQVNLILNQLNQPAEHFFPSPLIMRPTPGGGSSSKKDGE